MTELTTEDYKDILEMLPAFEDLSEHHQQVYLKLAAATYQRAEEERTNDWLIWIDASNKVTAIKSVREWSGLSLKPAKDLVESGQPLGPMNLRAAKKAEVIFKKHGVDVKYEMVE